MTATIKLEPILYRAHFEERQGDDLKSSRRTGALILHNATQMNLLVSC